MSFPCRCKHSPLSCQRHCTFILQHQWKAAILQWKMTQKCQFNATGLIFVIAYSEILMSLPLRPFCLWYLPPPGVRGGIFLAKQPGVFIVYKAAAVQAMFYGKKKKDGWPSCTVNSLSLFSSHHNLCPVCCLPQDLFFLWRLCFYLLEPRRDTFCC